MFWNILSGSMFTIQKIVNILYALVLIILMSILIFIAVLIFIEVRNRPEAIDVYRGRTELQITYKVVGTDTLKRDTLVVWRNDYGVY